LNLLISAAISSSVVAGLMETAERDFPFAGIDDG
jgi:hypothetical protein